MIISIPENRQRYRYLHAHDPPCKDVGVFDAALAEMEAEGLDQYGPQSFRDYCEAQDLGALSAPAHISVDSMRRLQPELCKHHTMVFRLGRHLGTGTSFALVRARHSIDDFFLIDAEWAANLEPRTDINQLTQDERVPYRLLSPIGEVGLVNMAVASGVLGHFLGVDEPASRAAPATGRHGTYSFQFRARPDQPHLEHKGGQVEVDALYAGRRNGRPVVAVLEAKEGPPQDSLGKHKLYYAWAALPPEARSSMVCEPVYMRCWMTDNQAHFVLARCNDPRQINALDELQVVDAASYTVKL